MNGVDDVTSLVAWIDQQFDRRLTWDDIARICRLWDKILVLKGIIDAEGARRAIDVGADAIVVSNHGRGWLLGGLMRPPCSWRRHARPERIGAQGDYFLTGK